MRRNLNCAAVWNAGIKSEATKTIMPNVEMNVSLGEGVRRLPVYCFVATVPVLPGCVSQGQTRHETLKNIKQAIGLYVETLLEDGLPVPSEVGKELVELQVPAR